MDGIQNKKEEAFRSYFGSGKIHFAINYFHNSVIYKFTKPLYLLFSSRLMELVVQFKFVRETFGTVSKEDDTQ